MHISNKPGPDEIFAALSHPVRLEIVAMLSRGEGCICEIAPNFQQERSVISRHLSLLEAAGVVRSRRQGRRVFYQVADHRMLKLLEIVLEIVKHPELARPVGTSSSPGSGLTDKKERSYV
ncbi:MAG: ArsR/SmtB family transcription factor [bacterium]